MYERTLRVHPVFEIQYFICRAGEPHDYHQEVLGSLYKIDVTGKRLGIC